MFKPAEVLVNQLEEAARSERTTPRHSAARRGCRRHARQDVPDAELQHLERTSLMKATGATSSLSSAYSKAIRDNLAIDETIVLAISTAHHVTKIDHCEEILCCGRTTVLAISNYKHTTSQGQLAVGRSCVVAELPSLRYLITSTPRHKVVSGSSSPANSLHDIMGPPHSTLHTLHCWQRALDFYSTVHNYIDLGLHSFQDCEKTFLDDSHLVSEKVESLYCMFWKRRVICNRPTGVL
ncbi:hypothetical protein J6590_000338 [Homalodisca vitripennis]|nr:hypothetical protein J6590_000338 [Homalodisca vitripennis]